MGTIGERVKQLRKELGLTQVQLGNLIGIAGGSVAKIEANASNITEAAIKLICATYKVNYEWLTEGRGDMFQAESLEDLVDRLMAGQSPMAISLMKMFVHLPDEEWVKFRDMCDRIKKEGTP